MKAILLNNEQRNRIISVAQPRKYDSLSRQNLNLMTAVMDEETGYILTLTFYLSCSISRVDNTDEYTYILLTDEGDFLIPCNTRISSCEGSDSLLQEKKTKESIDEMIDFYKETYQVRSDMKNKELEKVDLGGRNFTDWYLETYYYGRESVFQES